MTVVVILGILAAIAVYGFTKYIRSAHKSEVIGDLSNLSLRQTSLLAVNGHYASSTSTETTVYPSTTNISDGDLPLQWQPNDSDYPLGQNDAPYFRGGAAVHGFDALRFMAQGGQSYCGYGTISGHGSNAPDPDNDEPPSQTLGSAIFPDDSVEATRLYAGDWFYAFALCDFDQDGTLSAFTTQHYDARISGASVGAYVEGE